MKTADVKHSGTGRIKLEQLVKYPEKFICVDRFDARDGRVGYTFETRSGFVSVTVIV